MRENVHVTTGDWIKPGVPEQEHMIGQIKEIDRMSGDVAVEWRDARWFATSMRFVKTIPLMSIGQMYLVVHPPTGPKDQVEQMSDAVRIFKRAVNRHIRTYWQSESRNESMDTRFKDLQMAVEVFEEKCR